MLAYYYYCLEVFVWVLVFLSFGFFVLFVLTPLSKLLASLWSLRQLGNQGVCSSQSFRGPYQLLQAQVRSQQLVGSGGFVFLFFWNNAAPVIAAIRSPYTKEKSGLIQILEGCSELTKDTIMNGHGCSQQMSRIWTEYWWRNKKLNYDELRDDAKLLWLWPVKIQACHQVAEFSWLSADGSLYSRITVQYTKRVHFALVVFTRSNKEEKQPQRMDWDVHFYAPISWAQ